MKALPESILSPEACEMEEQSAGSLIKEAASFVEIVPVRPSRVCATPGFQCDMAQ